jgi:hypothetical protein
VSYQALCSTKSTDWVPYAEPRLGANGALQLLIPIDSAPMKLFRLRASN